MVKHLANGSWQAYVYDRYSKRKRYVGVYANRDTAERAVTEAKDLLRRCSGCGKSFIPAGDWQKRCSHECDDRVKQRARRRERHTEDDHWVYTCLDASMRIIYVGVTSTGLRRHREHGREMGWWKRVTLIRVEHYETREQALAAEAEAIDFHQPIYNTIGIVEGAA